MPPNPKMTNVYRCRLSRWYRGNIRLGVIPVPGCYYQYILPHPGYQRAKADQALSRGRNAYRRGLYQNADTRWRMFDENRRSDLEIGESTLEIVSGWDIVWFWYVASMSCQRLLTYRLRYCFFHSIAGDLSDCPTRPERRRDFSWQNRGPPCKQQDFRSWYALIILVPRMFNYRLNQVGADPPVHRRDVSSRLS
jgi:hypothetical protein